jgi:hypothetical protein
VIEIGLKDATPDIVLTGEVAVSVPPLPLSVIETGMPSEFSGFPAASWIWTAAENVAPLATLDGGCADMTSFAAAPAVIVIPDDCTLVRLPEVNVSV